MNIARLGLAAAIAVAATGASADNHGGGMDFDHVSCTGAENEIRILITGVKENRGLIAADLYPNREDGFLYGRARIKQVKFAAKAPTTHFCIRAPQSGEFAIAVYHDANANGRFDKTGLGLPAEPWGISNNPKVRFRAPTAAEAKFDVAPSGAKLEISLN